MLFGCSRFIFHCIANASAREKRHNSMTYFDLFLLRNVKQQQPSDQAANQRKPATVEQWRNSWFRFSNCYWLGAASVHIFAANVDWAGWAINQHTNDVTEQEMFISILSRHSIVHHRGVSTSTSTDHNILFCRLWKSIIIIYLFIIYRLNGDRLHIIITANEIAFNAEISVRENKNDEHVARVWKKNVPFNRSKCNCNWSSQSGVG